MIDILLFFGLLLLGLGVVASVWRNDRPAPLARQRMESPSEVSGPSQPEPIPAAHSFLVRFRLLPWMLGLLVAALIHFVFGWALPFVIAVGLIISLLGIQLESYLASQRTAKIETQLADAIDLMVAALRSGAGISDALENAMCESRGPLRPQLEEVVGRIHFGDNPRTVYHGLTQRVPLETFLLFSSAFPSNRKPAEVWLPPWRASAGRFVIALRLHGASAPIPLSPKFPLSPCCC